MLDVVQEAKAGKAIEALQKMSFPKAMVRRNGEAFKQVDAAIPASEMEKNLVLIGVVGMIDDFSEAEFTEKAVGFLLTCNLGEVITLFAAILIGWEAPLIATQLLWILLGIFLQLFVIEIPVMQHAFHLQMLDLGGWLIAISLGLVPLLFNEIFKIFISARK